MSTRCREALVPDKTTQKIPLRNSMFSGYVKQARSYLTQIFLHFYIKVHIALLSVQSSLTLSIFVNAKILFSPYKISIFTFMKIVLEQRSDDFMKIMPNPSRRTSNPIEFWMSDKSPLMLWLACDISFPPWNFFYLMIKAAKSTIALIW